MELKNAGISIVYLDLDCVWFLNLGLNMLRPDWQNCVGVVGDHDQIGSGRDVNEVGY